MSTRRLGPLSYSVTPLTKAEGQEVLALLRPCAAEPDVVRALAALPVVRLTRILSAHSLVDGVPVSAAHLAPHDLGAEWLFFELRAAVEGLDKDLGALADRMLIEAVRTRLEGTV